MTLSVRSLPLRKNGAGVQSLLERAQGAVAAARANADAVDRDARFPFEAFDALREARLLGIAVPAEFGGEGVGLDEVASLCAALGEACGSTGLIYAMHTVKIACLSGHHGGSPWQTALLAEIAQRQLLVASSTTEGARGGDVRSSEAPVEAVDGRIRLERKATVISYIEHADALVTTARRASDAATSDQVLLALRKRDYTLEPLLGWDTFGMRGTCSKGFLLRVDAEPAQIVPEDYAKIHVESMVPAAHLLWSAVWLGIATESYRRARAFVRQAARASGGKMPPAAQHLSRARVSLETMRGVLRSGAATITTPGAVSRDALPITLLKVQASELAVQTVLAAMRTCGLSGYRNDTEFSIGRMLRDVLSSPIMINNDRILANAEPTLLVGEAPSSALE